MGNRRQTHCKHGHEFTERNTIWKFQKAFRGRKEGFFRRCRTCHYECSATWANTKGVGRVHHAPVTLEGWLDSFWPDWRQHPGSARLYDLTTAFEAGRTGRKRRA